MPSNQMIETDFLVLRKSSYSETSLILAGLSPEHGQIHFMARGARRVGGKSFPVADIFRILHVKYLPGKSDLYNWRDMEMVRDFGSVAGSVKTYDAACRLADFALRNTVMDAPVPRFYRAVIRAFEYFQAGAVKPADDLNAADLLAPLVCTGVVYLDENGLLPDYPQDPAAQKRRDILLAAGEGYRPMPDLSHANWKKLAAWLKHLLAAG